MPSRRPADPEAVEAYLARLAPAPRRALERLRATIRRAAPDADELISYELPAFRQTGILVYYGAFSDHLSVFIPSSPVRARLAKELRPFSSGKGTVRFTPERTIPAALVARIVKARLAEDIARHRR